MAHAGGEHFTMNSLDKINAETIPHLIQTVLQRAKESRGRGVPTGEFSAVEAYAAGLCFAFGLTGLRSDEAASITYVTMMPEGEHVRKQLEAGRPLIDVMKFPLRPPRPNRRLLGNIKSVRSMRKKGTCAKP